MTKISDITNDTSSARRPRPTGLGFIRAVFSVIVISIFILALVFFVKQATLVDTSNLNTLINTVFSQFGYENSRIGKVAGDIIERVGDVGLENEHELNINSNDNGGNLPGTNDIPGDITSASTSRKEVSNIDNIVLRVAIASDVHLSKSESIYGPNKGYLASLFDIIKTKNIDTLLFLGDLTNYGDLESLQLGKEMLQDAGLKYKVIPGDRDLAASVGIANFTNVFNSHNYVFESDGYKFVMLDNSANYTLIPQETLDWFDKQLNGADFVLLSQPLYTEGLTMFSNVYMGSTLSSPEDTNLIAKQEEVKTQRNLILSLIRASEVKAVIAGDHHKSSKVIDKIKPSLTHFVVGAVGGNVNEYSQKSLQSQRFSILEVYKDGSFALIDTLIN